MSRYRPSSDEQAMIDRLTLSGFHVMRQGTYDRLRERVRVAEVIAQSEKDFAEHARSWARDCCAEERRLTDRLNRVCAGAAALGVPIQAINAALDGEDSHA